MIIKAREAQDSNQSTPNNQKRRNSATSVDTSLKTAVETHTSEVKIERSKSLKEDIATFQSRNFSKKKYVISQYDGSRIPVNLLTSLMRKRASALDDQDKDEDISNGFSESPPIRPRQRRTSSYDIGFDAEIGNMFDSSPSVTSSGRSSIVSRSSSIFGNVEDPPPQIKRLISRSITDEERQLHVAYHTLLHEYNQVR